MSSISASHQSESGVPDEVIAEVEAAYAEWAKQHRPESI